MFQDELEYFDELSKRIQAAHSFNAVKEYAQMNAMRELIQQTIRMRLIADPKTMLMEPQALKKKPAKSYSKPARSTPAPGEIKKTRLLSTASSVLPYYWR